MGWFGVYSALLRHDEAGLFEEMSPRNNPNDPSSALEFAVKTIGDDYMRSCVNAWADAWLRDPGNDCLRARGDRCWQIMNSVEALTKKEVSS